MNHAFENFDSLEFLDVFVSCSIFLVAARNLFIYIGRFFASYFGRGLCIGLFFEYPLTCPNDRVLHFVFEGPSGNFWGWVIPRTFLRIPVFSWAQDIWNYWLLRYQIIRKLCRSTFCCGPNSVHPPFMRFQRLSAPANSYLFSVFSVFFRLWSVRRRTMAFLRVFRWRDTYVHL